MFRKIYFFFLKDGFKRGEYLRKKNIFHKCGNKIFYQPRKMPSDPKLVEFGDNIVIASQVVFINHDVIHHIFNNMEEDSTSFNMGIIKIGSNVFVGANTIILPNVKICDNVIISAGSIVVKSIQESGVYAGNPLRKIKEFDQLFDQRKKMHDTNKEFEREEIIKKLWKDKEENKK